MNCVEVEEVLLQKIPQLKGSTEWIITEDIDGEAFQLLEQKDLVDFGKLQNSFFKKIGIDKWKLRKAILSFQENKIQEYDGEDLISTLSDAWKVEKMISGPDPIETRYLAPSIPAVEELYKKMEEKKKKREEQLDKKKKEKKKQISKS